MTSTPKTIDALIRKWQADPTRPAMLSDLNDYHLAVTCPAGLPAEEFAKYEIRDWTEGRVELVCECGEVWGGGCIEAGKCGYGGGCGKRWWLKGQHPSNIRRQVDGYWERVPESPQPAETPKAREAVATDVEELQGQIEKMSGLNAALFHRAALATTIAENVAALDFDATLIDSPMLLAVKNLRTDRDRLQKELGEAKDEMAKTANLWHEDMQKLSEYERKLADALNRIETDEKLVADNLRLRNELEALRQQPQVSKSDEEAANIAASGFVARSVNICWTKYDTYNKGFLGACQHKDAQLPALLAAARIEGAKAVVNTYQYGPCRLTLSKVLSDYIAEQEKQCPPK